jgi:cytohesin
LGFVIVLCAIVGFALRIAAWLKGDVERGEAVWSLHRASCTLSYDKPTVEDPTPCIKRIALDSIDSAGRRACIRIFPKSSLTAEVLWVEEGRPLDPKQFIRLERLSENQITLEILWCSSDTLNSVPRRPSPSGKTPPLHLTCFNGPIDEVKTLLAKEPTLLNTRDQDGMTPLHWAVLGGQIETIRTLLSAGASPNVRRYGQTPLHLAVLAGDVEAASELADNGADINARDFSELVYFFGHAGVRQPLGNDQDGDTALHIAAAEGSALIIEWLLERGIDSTARNEVGQTPLHIAAGRGHIDAVDILLTHEFDVDAKDRAGYTAIHHAVMNNHLTMVRLLLERGADEDARDVDGHTALDLAVQRGHTGIVCYLQDYRENSGTGE